MGQLEEGGARPAAAVARRCHAEPEPHEGPLLVASKRFWGRQPEGRVRVRSWLDATVETSLSFFFFNRIRQPAVRCRALAAVCQSRLSYGFESSSAQPRSPAGRPCGHEAAPEMRDQPGRPDCPRRRAEGCSFRWPGRQSEPPAAETALPNRRHHRRIGTRGVLKVKSTGLACSSERGELTSTDKN